MSSGCAFNLLLFSYLRVIGWDLASLRGALQASEYDILHFAGHGFRSTECTETSRFGLLLEDRYGDQDPITSDLFGRWVGDSGVRLVVLNACWSCAEHETHASGSFHGVAQNLVRLGIPAVVAMQHPIVDEAAPSLAEGFYQSLARDDLIEGALTETRLDMQRRDWQGRSWLTPALFLQAPDSQILGAGEGDFVEVNTKASLLGERETADHTRVAIGEITGHAGRFVGIDIEAEGELSSDLAAGTVDLQTGNISGNENIVTGRKIRFGGKK